MSDKSNKNVNTTFPLLTVIVSDRELYYYSSIRGWNFTDYFGAYMEAFDAKNLPLIGCVLTAFLSISSCQHSLDTYIVKCIQNRICIYHLLTAY